MNVIPKAAIWNGYDRQRRRYFDLHYFYDADNDFGLGYGEWLFRDSIRLPWVHITTPCHPKSQANSQPGISRT